jgi:hypothetical protein
MPSRALSLFAMLAAACSDWLGTSFDGNLGPGAGATVPAGAGTCSGTPTPCAGLPTLGCASVAGCVDRGTCNGTATTVGTFCSTETSPSACVATPGCFWSADCEGVPSTTVCSSFTEADCVAIPGCSWTPTAIGGIACAPLAPCTSSLQCGCGLICAAPCVGCTGQCTAR